MSTLPCRFLLPLLVLCGCVSPIDGGRGLPPIYEKSPPPDPDDPDSARWALRPLALFEREGDRSDFSLLWPIYRRTVAGDSMKEWLLPFWYSHRHVDAAGVVDQDSVLFPFLFWGSDPREGSYFLFFPVGGRLKGLLGQDRTDWVLFPLYIRAQDRERVSTHLLWPLINWIDGPHHDGGRLFPFYGRYTATTPQGQPKYDRRFYLWPFFHYHENNLDTERPSTAWWFFPLFGKIESKNLVRYSFLWPLYTFVRQGESTTVALPVLPIILSRGPQLQQTDLWPLFGSKRFRTPSGTTYRQYFLWPIQRYTRAAIGDSIQESYWFLPLFWKYRYRNLELGTERSTTRLWPLLSHKVLESGQREWNVIDILPFDDAPRFDRLYARLWRIYRYVERPDGVDSDWDLLWGLAKGSRRAEGRSFSILGGLLERSLESDGARWRVLYISF